MSRRVVAIVMTGCTVAAALLVGSTPAHAFTEGTSNNFFGVGAGFNNSGTNQNSFFGANAGLANTTGLKNSFFGAQAGRENTTGVLNSFFGHNAGLNTTGFSNSFFGGHAGEDNTTGCCNAFFGVSAGDQNTTGRRNAFFGFGAGGQNTTADANAFFGFDAGALNTTGFDNAFFGRDAGRSNTTANSNSFFGHNAGTSNTTGIFNTFIGDSAGALNTTGSHNAFLGLNAGDSNTTGFENTLIGVSAGHNNTTGAKNVIVGTVAGSSNTTESGNTFLGAVATGAAGVTNATALGQQARVSQSDSLVLGSINGLNGATSDVKVGIGTDTPEDPLHVRRTDGTTKVLVEEASATLGGRELLQLTNNGATRFRLRNTSNDATWDFQSSSGPGSFVIDRVGGPSTLDLELRPTGELLLNNTVTATGFVTSSNRNLKTDISPAKASKLMALLRQLDISTWRFKTQPEGTVNLGPMAQDFHRLFGMGTETTIDVRDLAALALVGVQALDERLTKVEGRTG